ncbi:MAG: sulfatase-like hydrolase/transferase, partial [Pelotomaculum sp.]|nr:sulfatase-like hydrolase/transferase [Pelotomaculum sp.]
PHSFKKYFYTVNITAVDNNPMKGDLVFADQVISKSKAVEGKYSFKLFHLLGAHPPFCLNEKLEYEKLEYSRSSYKTQARATLEITKRFLTSLKSIGVYDNSMIFIVGDHGLGSFGVNVQASGYTEDNKVANITSSNTIATGIPLILVKPFASMADMKISDAPVSLSDIPKTIISELGLKDDLPGCSMFEVKESDFRERRFLAYKWEHEYWKKKYLPVMDEYIINGFSWLNQSWKPTYRRFTPSGVQDTRPQIYEYGSQIQFGEGGNAEQYQVQGWSYPEKGFTWTDGKSVSLVIPVNQPQSDLTLSASLFPFTAGGVVNQNVYIDVNGDRLGEWIITAAGEYKIKIPKEHITDSLLEINFELPNAVSPAELNIGNDPRSLGIAVKSIIISEKN